jgi:hypothetical protein
MEACPRHAGQLKVEVSIRVRDDGGSLTLRAGREVGTNHRYEEYDKSQKDKGQTVEHVGK